jgi:hypothetical protein
MGIASIRLPILLWREVISQLRKRGEDRAESGAFLLGHQRGPSARVTTYVCYDDLDPLAYQSGGIVFHAVGCAALWRFCREKGLLVLADVHTHMGKGISQSHTDQLNPMIPVIGHTAMIVPDFGRTPWLSLRAVGVYEYLGSFAWRAHSASQRLRRVSLTLW